MDRAYDYTVHTEASNSAFKNACIRIEKYCPDCKKERLLVDVDGSLLQNYSLGRKTICVQNDYYVDAVYVQSDIPLDELFGTPVIRHSEDVK